MDEELLRIVDNDTLEVSLGVSVQSDLEMLALWEPGDTSLLMVGENEHVGVEETRAVAE